MVSAAAVAVLIACAANWDLNKPNVLRAADPHCILGGAKSTVWSAEETNNQPSNCDVRVTYRGPAKGGSACRATLYWNSANGTPGPGDGPLRAGQPAKTVNITGASRVEFSCEGTEEDREDTCHYDVERVSCVKPGDVVNVIPGGAAVARFPVKCGASQSIWTPPAAPAKRSNCNVTVSWQAPPGCSADILPRYVGNERQVNRAGPGETKLMTFVHVRELSLSCDGTNPTDSCTYSIVSQECK
ncbi:MAG: hypothetical protein E6J90_32005 [Deltaproteobacteria bacterium]|nr:MAG: hypothetical protein E6J90_32005 [Deltaproteobacteria bacterium]